MKRSNIVTKELRRISSRNGGLLLPDDVVESARPTTSPLHNYFNWDDANAGHEYRLWQARELIRTTVRYMDIKGDNRPVRVFVSLSPDRYHGGGYRNVVSVLSDKALRAQMLEDALNDMELFQAKYGHLVELTEVFVAAAKAKKRLHQQRKTVRLRHEH